MLRLNKKIGGLMLGAGLLLAGGAAQAAESYPSKPVHILVPYAAGGAVDVLARTAESCAPMPSRHPTSHRRRATGRA